MIAALICVFSVFAFLEFFLIYCRSTVANSIAVALSENVRTVAGMNSSGAAPDDFHRLIGLLRLCPDGEMHELKVRAIRTYYMALRFVDGISDPKMPRVSAWVKGERRQCSHFAAVVLDQCISLSQDLRAQSAGATL
jgi:hypothetical protein